MALSSRFQSLAGDPYAAHAWLVSSGLLDRLERRLRERIGTLLTPAEARLPRQMAARALKLAAAKSAHFEAREVPDFEAWLEGLALPEIEERWFLGLDQDLLRALRAFPLDDATREVIAVQAVDRAIAFLQRFDPSRGSLRDYVFGIARRRARDLVSRRTGVQRELELDELHGHSAALAHLEQRDLGRLVFRVLRACPRAERLVFRARVRGLDYETIAARLGYGVPSTHNVMHRVRATLRRRLDREWEGLA